VVCSEQRSISCDKTQALGAIVRWIGSVGRMHEPPGRGLNLVAPTSLGLSIVQGIINDHGGRITFDSVVGHGTRWTLEGSVRWHGWMKRVGR
jgi:hypothetical protein